MIGAGPGRSKQYNRPVRRLALSALLLAAACGADPPPGDRLAAARARLVDEVVAPRGVSDPRALHALRTVPRHLFLPEDRWDVAYEDRAVRRPDGRTVTAPALSAYMLEKLALDPDSRVLECGTRTGWFTALLATAAGEVVTIDAREEVSTDARATLGRLSIGGVDFRVGDPAAGAPDAAPFDAIVLNGHVRHVPRALYAQLRPGGRLLAPVGVAGKPQTLILVVKGAGGPERTEALIAVRFVPLRTAR